MTVQHERKAATLSREKKQGSSRAGAHTVVSNE